MRLAYDMGRTTRFIKIAKSFLASLQNGRGSPEFLDFYTDFAKGKCFMCKQRLYVDDFIKSGSGVEYQFRCGHKIVITGLPEVKSKSSGKAYSRVGSNEDGNHDVYTEREGIEHDQDSDEIILAKSFSHSFYPKLSVFEKDKQNSSIDVVAKSKDGSDVAYFQITKIDDSEYWKSLYKEGHVSKVMTSISDSVSNSIRKKLKYSPKDRKNMVLLIDARPGVVLEVAQTITDEINSLLEEANFKEVWLVGTADLLTHRIY